VSPRAGTLAWPAQLPAEVAGFTGREGALAQLNAVLADKGDAGAVVVAAISGSPGVGKTALALHWARSIKDRFTDGNLFADLRGYDPIGIPADPGGVLEGFLRALGVAPGRIPAELEPRSALLRTRLHGKRLLIVLDNVATPEQVRPLLPGSPDCLVIVTSRSRLSGLIARDGAARVILDAFSEAESVSLLRKTLGGERVDAELEAAAGIAARCGYLPLALRIAADRGVARPHLKLAELAGQLAAERDRLDVLAAGDDEAAAVRAVFSWSYRALPADEARMFRLLGLHAGPDISVPAAAALAAVSEPAAGRLLDLLAAAHLAGETAADRYRLHDLLRVYAAERAGADDSEEDRAAATRRLLTWYLHAADAADRLLMPSRRHVPLGSQGPHCEPPAFTSYEQALEWCEAEHPSLVAAVRLAAETGHDDIAWKLPVALWGFFELRKPWADWIAVHRVAVDSARRAGDARGEAWALNGLCAAYFDLRQFGETLASLRKALEIRRRIGDRQGEVSCLNNLGLTYRELGRLGDAMDCDRQALATARQIGDRRNEGIALNNLGETYRELRRPAEAAACFREALTLVREIGERIGEGFALHNLGQAHQELRQHGDALACYQQALAVRRLTGDRQGEAVTLRGIGDVLGDTGQPEAARASWHEALGIFEDLGDPQADQVRSCLQARA